MVSTDTVAKTTKHVCVIGAGPSGLVAARELRKEGHKPVVFEQNHDIGGQWLYDDINIKDESSMGNSTTHLKVHSSVYASLRLTSPREIMGYSDFPFVTRKGRDMRRFPGHKELYLYLKDFCSWFGLREMIRFNTRVEYVGVVDLNVDDQMKWVVRSRKIEKINNVVLDDDDDEVVVEEIYDAVVIANGHYSQPRLPNIKGMDIWRRKQLHSHVYRVPDPFRDELIGFPFFESQAIWISQVLSGKRTLPSFDDMMDSINDFYKLREMEGIPKHNTHDIANFEYCDKYGEYCDFPKLEEWRKRLCLSAIRNADADLENYRDKWDDDDDGLLKEAYQSQHFKILNPENGDEIGKWES